MFVLYVLSHFCTLVTFIDRLNLANARIQGLEIPLNMRGHGYNVAAMVLLIDRLG